MDIPRNFGGQGILGCGEQSTRLTGFPLIGLYTVMSAAYDHSTPPWRLFDRNHHKDARCEFVENIYRYGNSFHKFTISGRGSCAVQNNP